MCAISTIDQTIATPRLRLRPYALSDAPRVAAFVDDYDVARMTSSIPHPNSLAQTEEFLALSASGALPGWRFAMEHREEGVIGSIGLEPRGGFRELGYWVGRPHWGRGYATEAASAMLQWAQDVMDIRVVSSGHFDDNPASGRVLEKAGFLYTGVVEPRFSRARGEDARIRMMVWLA